MSSTDTPTPASDVTHCWQPNLYDRGWCCGKPDGCPYKPATPPPASNGIVGEFTGFTCTECRQPIFSGLQGASAETVMARVATPPPASDVTEMEDLIRELMDEPSRAAGEEAACMLRNLSARLLAVAGERDDYRAKMWSAAAELGDVSARLAEVERERDEVIATNREAIAQRDAAYAQAEAAEARLAEVERERDDAERAASVQATRAREAEARLAKAREALKTARAIYAQNLDGGVADRMMYGINAALAAMEASDDA